jgi:hypothetical protein
MGQDHVGRWIDDLLPLVSDNSDPLGVRQRDASFRHRTCVNIQSPDGPCGIAGATEFMVRLCSVSKACRSGDNRVAALDGRCWRTLRSALHDVFHQASCRRKQGEGCRISDASVVSRY